MKFLFANLDHEFFNYLSKEEKIEINDEVKKQKAQVILLEDKGLEVLTAVINIEADRVHVREVGGAITAYIEYVELYCKFLCEKLKVNLISFCAEREGVKLIGYKMGYEENKNYPNEFIKKVA